jgi:hypothetical protein
MIMLSLQFHSAFIQDAEDLNSSPLLITELLNLYELGGWEDSLRSGWKQEFARFNCLMPELNPSAQRQSAKIFYWGFVNFNAYS